MLSDNPIISNLNLLHMKKFTFVLMVLLAYTGFTMAQTIEDFESIKMNPMEFGTTGKMTVVANPDPVGNPSLYCVKFLRPGVTNGGKAWSGFWSTLPVAVDVTVNKYVHVKVWKSRLSPIKFKLKGGTAGDSEIVSMNPQTLTNAWEDIVFDFSAKTGTYPIVSLMPDFEDPLVQADDLTMYFDEIYVNNNPAVGTTPVTVLENFETITLNTMEMGTNGKLTLVENPDKSGINSSSYVEKFVRPFNGQPWSGFWSELPTPVDATTNKYVHVKVWKSRLSPIKFKLKGGTAGDSEIFSMNPQTLTNAWEDIVFDFSAKTGTYPIVSLMPDFEDPLTLTSDITLYFDDIVLNNEPNKSVSVTFNVDMHGSNLTTGQKVYIAGNITGWAIPDTKPEYEMLDAEKDSIYSISLVVTAGDLAFKFFKGGSGWGGGEWNGDPNRTITVTEDAVVNALWGTNGFVGKREISQANKIQMYPNPVRNELNISSTADVRRVIITNTLGKVVGNINYTGKQTINTSDFSRGLYFVTFINADGTKATQKLIKD